MAKSPKEKVIHKAMKSADKFYNEIPGNMKLDLTPPDSSRFQNLIKR